MKPPKKERRLPILADRFSAQRLAPHERYIDQKVFEALQRKTRVAHKFVLDENAATRVAHVVRDIPELLVREHAFAVAPYDLTWIEYPAWKYWRELGNDPSMMDDTSDHTVGYLIDGAVCTIVTGGTIGNPLQGPWPTILQFHLNSEWPADVQADFASLGGVDLDTVDQFLWGSTYLQLDTETRRKLRETNSVHVIPGILNHHQAQNVRRRLQSAFTGGAGEIRTIIAMLLMLNRPTITRYSNQPASKGFHRGKLQPYMSHTTVTIDWDAVPTMRLLGTPDGDGVARRRHEVRGHFKHDRVAHEYMKIAGCIHEYTPTYGPESDWEIWINPPLGRPGEPGVPRNWVCAQCGGKRWWQKKSERGDASKGWVEKDYNITTH